MVSGLWAMLCYNRIKCGTQELQLSNHPSSYTLVAALLFTASSDMIWLLPYRAEVGKILCWFSCPCSCCCCCRFRTSCCLRSSLYLCTARCLRSASCLRAAWFFSFLTCTAFSLTRNSFFGLIDTSHITTITIITWESRQTEVDSHFWWLFRRSHLRAHTNCYRVIIESYSLLEV